MQSNPAAEADRTPGVEPPIEPRAAWRVGAVRIIAQGLLDVRFVDGTEGIVDLRPRLGRDDIVGTLFEPLRDASFFARAFVHLGAVEWPGEIDLPPDVMYDEIRAHGRCIVE